MLVIDKVVRLKQVSHREAEPQTVIDGDALDDIFASLSDPIRRGIIAQLTHGPCSVTQLSMPFDVSAPAISRHLNVLERSGLIERWKRGRVNYCRLVPYALTQAAGWIEQHKAFWEHQFDALADYLDRGETTMNSAAIADDPGQIGFELQRRFRASPERVFRAWTRPVALREWWCPPGWMAGEIEVDLRVGGVYRIAMTRPAGGAPVAVSGQFVEVDPPDRLIYTWCWEGAFTEMPPTLVSLQLEGSAEETLLTLRHENFVDAALRHQHRSGWISACDRLDRLVTAPTMLGAQRAAK